MKLIFELNEREVAALQSTKMAATSAASKMMDTYYVTNDAEFRNRQIKEGCALIDKLIELAKSTGSKA